MAEGRLWAEDDGLIPLRRLAPWAAALLLAVVAALMAVGLAASLAHGGGPPVRHDGADASLYRHVIDGLAHGQGYYVAAPRELRRGGFPLRPFMAVRPPLLAAALARLPSEAARWAALGVLALATLCAWAWRLADLARRAPLRYACAVLLLACGITPVLSSSAYLFHETWAGLLIALSLALHRPDRWGASLAVALLAALLRELAAPYLVVMAAFALLEGRRGEAIAWAAALGVFALALAGHAALATAATSAADPRSPGWLGLGGWPFVLHTAQWNALVQLTPPWSAALIVPLAALGLACAPGALGRRTGAVALGYMAGFCVVGRSDNAYWGLMIAPLWPLGLAGVDLTMRRLVAGVRAMARPSTPSWVGTADVR